MQNQVYLFIIFILNGFLISILFDVFRILRKSFKTGNIVTYIEDIMFWILTALIVLYSIFKFNNGELRVYIFIGISLGIAIYMLVFSKVFIKFSVYLINVIKKVINILFIRPIKYIFKILKKIIFKPITFLFINIRKILSVFKINLKSLFNRKKKSKYKKDFA